MMNLDNEGKKGESGAPLTQISEATRSPEGWRGALAAAVSAKRDPGMGATEHTAVEEAAEGMHGGVASGTDGCTS